jgi:hypothetical protein
LAECAHAPWRGVALPHCREPRRVGGATAPGAETQKARSRGLYAEGHDPKEGEGCARIMVRAERNVSRARASAIDERDLQVLLLLLEHKILTTHQITSLCFRSLRRCSTG